MEEDLRHRLMNTVGVRNSVGSNIDWEERPKAAGLPAITLTLTSRIPIQTYKGPVSLVPSRVQVDVWATSVKQAVMIARLFNPIVPDQGILANPAISGKTRFGPSFVESEQSGGTDEVAGGTLVFRRILHLTVWHSPA